MTISPRPNLEECVHAVAASLEHPRARYWALRLDQHMEQLYRLDQLTEQKREEYQSLLHPILYPS